MTDRITAIIVDTLPQEHIYTNFDFEYIQTNGTENIQQIVDQHRTIDAIITIGNDINFNILQTAPFEIRKKWFHFDTFDAEAIKNSVNGTFLLNIRRDRQGEKLFSIFTPSYKTTWKQAWRLYSSLLAQDYTNWNLWVLDDNPSREDRCTFEMIHDSRIHIIKNVTNHGCIGFNKHMIAMCCDGDYLVEVDHDDELTPDCLSTLLNAFNTYPDSKFVFSDAIELLNEKDIITYGEGFAFGQGIYRKEVVNGTECEFPVCTPSINCKSIRGIYSQPNHVRCWERQFYHSIGGHYTELSVCDDMELIIQTFLHTKITRINKVLYIQHETGDRENGGENTQSKRFEEIQKINWMLYWKYDKDIHNRIIELCGNDQIWENDHSNLDKDIPLKDLIDLGYQYHLEEEQ